MNIFCIRILFCLFSFREILNTKLSKYINPSSSYTIPYIPPKNISFHIDVKKIKRNRRAKLWHVKTSYLNMSFRAYIIGILNKSNLQL